MSSTVRGIDKGLNKNIVKENRVRSFEIDCRKTRKMKTTATAATTTAEKQIQADHCCSQCTLTKWIYGRSACNPHTHTKPSLCSILFGWSKFSRLMPHEPRKNSLSSACIERDGKFYFPFQWYSTSEKSPLQINDKKRKGNNNSSSKTCRLATWQWQ